MRDNIERLQLNENLTIKLSDLIKYTTREKVDIVLLDALVLEQTIIKIQTCHF